MWAQSVVGPQFDTPSALALGAAVSKVGRSYAAASSVCQMVWQPSGPVRLRRPGTLAVNKERNEDPQAVPPTARARDAAMVC